MSVNVTTAKEIFLLEITENHDFDINFFISKTEKNVYINQNGHSRVPVYDFLYHRTAETKKQRWILGKIKVKQIPWNIELKRKQKELIELNSKLQTIEIDRVIQDKEKELSKIKENLELKQKYIAQIEEEYKKQKNDGKFKAAESIVKLMESHTIGLFIRLIVMVENKISYITQLRKNHLSTGRLIHELERMLYPDHTSTSSEVFTKKNLEKIPEEVLKKWRQTLFSLKGW